MEAGMRPIGNATDFPEPDNDEFIGHLKEAPSRVLEVRTPESKSWRAKSSKIFPELAEQEGLSQRREIVKSR
jgi:hypothetical protein